MTRRTRKNNRKRSKKNSIRKRNIKKTYRQKGGTNFNAAQKEQLTELGFTEQQITLLQARLGNIPSNNAMNLIQISLQQINPQTHLPNTPQEIIDSLEDDEGRTDSENDDSDDENDEQPQENGLNDAFIEEDGVEGNQDNNNNDLMLEDLMEGGRMRGKRGMGGKRRKTRKTKKSKKTRKGKKSRKMNGGALYGTGVGANNYDPNYSIHNTPALTLFPYKPLNN